MVLRRAGSAESAKVTSPPLDDDVGNQPRRDNVAAAVGGGDALQFVEDAVFAGALKLVLVMVNPL
jgi:hypothetical protein